MHKCSVYACVFVGVYMSFSLREARHRRLTASVGTGEETSVSLLDSQFPLPRSTQQKNAEKFLFSVFLICHQTYILFNEWKVDFLSGKQGAVPWQAANAVIKFTCVESLLLCINAGIKKNAAVPFTLCHCCSSTVPH